MNPIGLPPAASWNVQGNLPFGGGGAGMFMGLGGSPQQAAAQLGPNYANAYNSSLAMNQSNYNNILAGYQQTLASQTSAQQAIQAGYTNLYNDVQAKIQSQGQTRATDIGNSAAMRIGEQTQGLINRGLGNTTVQDSVVRGINDDRDRQLTANSEAVSGLQANYAQSLGLAGLNSRSQQLQDQAGLVARQLGWMDSVSSPYPNAGMYGQLASQYGQSAQQQANAGQMPGAYGGGSFAHAGNPGPKVGYVPGPTPGGYGGGMPAGVGFGGGYSGGLGGGLSAMSGASMMGGGYSSPVAAAASPWEGAYSGDFAAPTMQTPLPWEGLDYGGGGNF